MSKPAYRTIVITGGAQGIGRVAALLCARRGDRIAVFDIDSAAAKAVAEEAVSLGAREALGLACNVKDEHQVERAFAEVSNTLGSPWGVFANAAIDRGGFVHELAVETWQELIDTNLTGVFLTCKHALRTMLRSDKGGSIVCASSPGASVAFSAGGAAAYSASKGGVSTLVRCMAIEYAANRIRVNAIVPGPTETRLMWSNVPPDQIAEMRTRLEKEVPLGRLSSPEEPAHAVAWLLSEDSSYVTGSHLVCDGGVLAKASISV